MAYDEPLKRALNLAGGPSALAGKLGIVPSAVTQWTKVPPRHIGRISALTGMEAHELRPDLWEPPAQFAPTETGAA